MYKLLYSKNVYFLKGENTHSGYGTRESFMVHLILFFFLFLFSNFMYMPCNFIV